MWCSNTTYEPDEVIVELFFRFVPHSVQTLPFIGLKRIDVSDDERFVEFSDGVVSGLTRSCL